MNKLATTKMSSKGQIVIPESIRNRLNFGHGTQFIVLGERDTLILKSITMPNMKEFYSLRAKAQKQAKKSKLKKRDLNRAIKKARRSV